MSADLVIENVVKSYDEKHIVVNGVSLNVQAGELVSFLGPSGCGKTTILRMIAGLLMPNSGLISIQGKNVTHAPAYKRDIGMVFQNYALFPHLTVAENIAFGLRMRKVNRAEIKKRVEEALELVNLAGYGDRYSKNLSGGQQQRVALARALVLHPAVLLLDEPLSALDAKLRSETREEIRRLQQKLGLATVFVTHDQEEALAMSDRIAVLSHGIVQQFDTPSGLFENPDNVFVAKFMGVSNVFASQKTGSNQFQTSDGLIVYSENEKEDIVAIGIRPERIKVESGSYEGSMNCFSGTIIERTYTGSMIRVVVRLDSGPSIIALIPSNSPSSVLQEGHQVMVNWDPKDTLLLKAELSK